MQLKEGDANLPNYTREAIKASFIKLLNEKPLNRITVKNIISDCKVSRNTFYYHFKDVPELLEVIIKDLLDELVKNNTTIDSVSGVIDMAYRYYKENKKAIYHIYNSVDRVYYEDFLLKMCEHTASTYVNETAKTYPLKDVDKAALIHLLKCQFFGLTMEWSKDDMESDIVESCHKTIDLFLEIIIKKSDSQNAPSN